MPRNEGFLDPGAGPLASFAWDLRALREKAGAVPYRVLSKRAGFCASTLSVAASGAKLPSLDVTLAYVQACGGDPEEWGARWHALAAQHSSARAQPGLDAQPGIQVAPPYDADERGEPARSDAAAQIEPSLAAPPDSSRPTDCGVPPAGDHASIAANEGLGSEAVPRAEAPAELTACAVTNGGPWWRSRLPVVSVGRVATVALTLATAVLGLRVAMPEGTGSTPASGRPEASASPAGTPMQQADALYALIYQFAPMRSDANDAIWDVTGCRNLSNAQSKLRAIARKRQEQVEQLATLDVSKVPGSVPLVTALKHAWITSAQTDTAYANIAADLQSGCTTGAVRTDPSYQQADTDAQAASAAKIEAARLWNANADELGQLRISVAEL
jgi:hypothetical protein